MVCSSADFLTCYKHFQISVDLFLTHSPQHDADLSSGDGMCELKALLWSFFSKVMSGNTSEVIHIIATANIPKRKKKKKTSDRTSCEWETESVLQGRTPQVKKLQISLEDQ